MKISYVANYIPTPWHGTGVHVLALLRYLKLSGCAIEYVCTDSLAAGRVPWVSIDRDLDEIVRVSIPGTLRLGKWYVNVSPKDWLIDIVLLMYQCLPGIMKDFYRRRLKNSAVRHTGIMGRRWDQPSKGGLKFAVNHLRKSRPDVAIADYVWMAGVLDAVGNETLKVVFAHDVQYARVLSFREREVVPDNVIWERDDEAAALAKADVVLAVQNDEAEVIKSMVPDCEVMTLPLPVTLQQCTANQIRGRCIYVGSGAIHNVHGLEWFLREVWPLVLVSTPWAELHVCGDVGNHFHENFPRVKFMGRVADLSSEYSETELCVIPNLVGSGLKIKLVEALSYGRACVSTDVGLQGMMELSGNAVLLANNAQEFAMGVTRVLNNVDLRRHMEQDAEDFVELRLSVSVVCQPFVDRIIQHIEKTRAACAGSGD